jgi:hypothetical protein
MMGGCQSIGFGKNDRANDCILRETEFCNGNNNWDYYRILTPGVHVFAFSFGP